MWRRLKDGQEQRLKRLRAMQAFEQLNDSIARKKIRISSQLLEKILSKLINQLNSQRGRNRKKNEKFLNNAWTSKDMDKIHESPNICDGMRDALSTTLTSLLLRAQVRDHAFLIPVAET